MSRVGSAIDAASARFGPSVRGPIHLSHTMCVCAVDAWYSLTTAVSYRMPEYCVPPLHCGTNSPVWMNGSHPIGKVLYCYLINFNSQYIRTKKQNNWTASTYTQLDSGPGTKRLQYYSVNIRNTQNIADRQLGSVLFFRRPRYECWPHHGHTFSIYPCPLSFWVTLPRRVLSTSWCCPSRSCVVFLACVHLALFLALSLSLGNCLVSSWCDHSMLASLLWWCLAVPSLLQLC